jgi:acetyl/propionyl-CoA carboxylase alpha subunit
MKKTQLHFDGKTLNLSYETLENNKYKILLEGHEFIISSKESMGGILLEENETYYPISLTYNPHKKEIISRIESNTHTIKIKDKVQDISKSSKKISLQLLSPITGIISSILIKEKQILPDHTHCISIIAMKMENKLYNLGELKVKKIVVKENVQVQEGDILIEFEEVTKK